MSKPAPTFDNANHVIAWNTGNAYTEDGQRIAASVYRNGVAFRDLDRMITGWIKPEQCKGFDLSDLHDVRALTIRCYERGYDYEMSPIGDDYDYNEWRAVESKLKDAARNVASYVTPSRW